MYFSYYATQELNNIGGEAWKKWNENMREQLIRPRTAPTRA
jgi:hypothetical protein